VSLEQQSGCPCSGTKGLPEAPEPKLTIWALSPLGMLVKHRAYVLASGMKSSGNEQTRVVVLVRCYQYICHILGCLCAFLVHARLCPWHMFCTEATACMKGWSCPCVPSSLQLSFAGVSWALSAVCVYSTGCHLCFGCAYEGRFDLHQGMNLFWGFGPGLPVLTQLPIKELQFRSVGPYRLHQQSGFGGCLSSNG